MKLNHEDYSELLSRYSEFRISKLQGRYLQEQHVLDVFKSLSHNFKIINEGHSEEGRIISSFKIGSGSRKILIWSQMHGNESTTTKSVVDFINYLSQGLKYSQFLLERCSFIIVPVLNPDGAHYYTRVNANGVDLNRDALQQTQAESKVLQAIYKKFQPDICFNMHDQRTIFSAGDAKKPATVSFLSPSYNESRDINEVRRISMSLISSANSVLQMFIPNQVGRYDDGFNINCIGDYLQAKGTPTVLFEAGHFAKDYKREETRKYIFIALLQMIMDIAQDASIRPAEAYFDIPENKKLFYDVILRNAILNEKPTDIALQYKEVLKGERIDFVPVIEKTEHLPTYYGHKEIDLEHQPVKTEDLKKLTVGDVLSSFKVNDNVFVI
ncbi:M14 family zinc carboxypeptidase [Psychroflexus tropicus]|uniref:M14 family zinc carboxypeptidase n=1 Tax=Psychroflexus tropicus TaxID=197345 RepID=UPI00038264A0|nr:M14 family zinc carboxypeptidase [Psychroflexus tropicus]